jgi:hypothetical protein
METLDQIALRHGTDKASNVHRFTPIYEPLFEPFRDQEIRLLEIGVYEGASLRTWQDYFRKALIVGVDINPAAKTHEAERVIVMVGDQANRDFLSQVAESGPFQIVIDDGGHLPDQQRTSLTALWASVLPGGIYAVEDIHTSYLEDWQGAWRREGTMVEMLKDVLDDVNEPWHHQPTVLPNLASIHLYQELALLLKRPSSADSAPADRP